MQVADPARQGGKETDGVVGGGDGHISDGVTAADQGAAEVLDGQMGIARQIQIVFQEKDAACTLQLCKIVGLFQSAPLVGTEPQEMRYSGQEREE